MIGTERVYNQLEKQTEFISVVELAMILESSASETRQALKDLGDRVYSNDCDEWRVNGSLVHKLELSPLSASEIEERDELENTVQQAFYVAGQALKVLRDRKLYRETHGTFESYVKERFDFTRIAAYYLISAAEVVNNLKCQPMVNILPTSERQCREIAKLPPEVQPQVWLTSVEKAHGKIPSGRIIKEVVNQMRGKPKMREKTASEKIVRTPGMKTEYLIYSDRETYELLEAYRLKVGAATKNGAIRRLIEFEKQQTH